MDRYLFDWICGEMQLRPVEQVAQWQQLFCDLIGYMLRQGMPMEKLDGLTFLQMSQQSRNAEEALLVVLNACARVTKKISKIEWKNPESFGEWLSKLQRQRIDGNNTLAFDCLSFLSLVNCKLICKDLDQANLQRADLQQVNLVDTSLYAADLQWANLQQANLQRTNLQRANLQQANLQRANLQQADLFWANLQQANLQETKLRKADLEGVNTKNVDLSQVSWVDDYGIPLRENP